MCGLAGSHGAPFQVTAALNRIAHRGPDGRGVYADEETVLGHVRLAIHDPTPRSDQPFHYGGVVLTFVGEVWNFRELRHHLEHELFYEFRTTGDTEVVAAMLHEYGPRALPMLEGMFALAWLQRGRDETRVYLARDRFGKVPLYFKAEGAEDELFGRGGVSWASERKAWPAPDAAAATAVPPGYYYDVTEGELYGYYAVPRLEEDCKPSDVRRMLSEGVSARLSADVPVCCLISGGLDSSAVLALVKEHKPDVVAYTAVFDPASEDTREARRLCKELGVPLEEVRVDLNGNVDHLREAVRAIEVPSKTQVEIATLCLPLARRIYADGFRVCLSGEGADELFGGYGTLARRATDDERWRRERLEFLAKMGRSDFMRVNKAFMAHGVECRTPFLHRPLVEAVLSLGVKECPPGKRLLKSAVVDLLPTRILQRRKLTFQGAAGVAGHYDDLLLGKQRKVYNQLAREEFGGIPRG